MAKYKLVFKKSVAKDLRTIPKADVKKILKTIDALAKDSRGEGSINLSGLNLYRARQGLYRIVYEIRDLQLIFSVIKVSHRSSIYRDI